LRPCRELNRAIREIFSLIRESALVRFFGICFADKCDRPDRPRLRREGEEGAARCSKPPRSKPAFCPGERRARHSRNLAAKFVDANKRRFGLRDGGVGPVARRQTYYYRARPKLRDRTPLDMLMTLQGVYEKSLGTLSPSPRRAPRWTRFGQLASSIYRSLTERLPRQHSAW
jgi:hypothetical protein